MTAGDEAESDLVVQGRELLRVSRLRRVVLIGICAAAAVLFAMAGGALWDWWPWRVWMIPALLMPLLLVVLAFFSLKAPETVRKRLWVRRTDLLVSYLLSFFLLAWGIGDVVGFGGGFYGGMGAGVGVAIANIIREWPRERSDAAHHEDGSCDE